MPWKRYWSALRNFDWVLFSCAFLLTCFGLSAIYSLAISHDQPDFLNFRKQIMFAAIGLILFFLLTLINFRFWQDLSYFIYGLISFFLIAVLFFGRTISGTTGWFSLLGINFQPVEVAKISLIIMLAWYLSKTADQIKQLKTFFISGMIAVFFFGLVLLQPDFGSAIILFIIWLAMVIMAGANRKHLLICAVGIIVASSFAWFFLFQDYQKDRLLTFINPQSDPYHSGYNVHQAMIAVGAGGLFGRGLGLGSQSQLKFLPASQTDFIFAVIAEELGFLGVALVLFFWALLFYRLIKALKSAKDNFAVLFIFGTSVLLFCHVFINIGMNIGLVPVTGIPLPFLSYGGSFLVSSFILIGITESIIIRNQNST